MVSAITFDQLVDAYARFKNRAVPDLVAARSAILEFLGWDDVEIPSFAQDVRIILVAANFSKELTTCVIWLNDHNLDVRCVRMRPYKIPDGPILLDVQQIIPLPEASAFQTQIGVKRSVERQDRTDRGELRLRFWQGLLDYARTKTSLHAGRNANTGGWIAGSAGRAGFSFNYVARRTDCQVELWIGIGPRQTEKNKAAFKALKDQQEAIHEEFGGELVWAELPDSEGCRISYVIEGGYKAPSDQWPTIFEALVDAMMRLDRALRTRILKLGI